MEVLFRSCCGLDVHAQTVVACLLKDGHKTTRTFSTMTGQLLLLADWLVSEECQYVAIESTGVYWRPVFNILEGLIHPFPDLERAVLPAKSVHVPLQGK